jgi:hypothetical protein
MPLITLLAARTPNSGGQIPLFGRIGEIAPDSNEIDCLLGPAWPSKGVNRRFSRFFPVEQGNPAPVAGQLP